MACTLTAAVVVLLGAGVAEGQRGSVSLEVDKHIAALGEAVRVTVRITVDGRGGYSQLLPPTMSGFRVTGSGMTSQNIEVINWRVRRKETHSYVAIPTRLGRLTVGPAAIRVGRRWVKSNTVKVTVKKQGQSPAPADPTPGQAPAPAISGGRALPSVFIAAVAVPRKVFVGQQVVATWKLYTQSDVLGFRTLKQPTTDGFWSEDLKSPRRLQFEREQLQGRTFYAAVLSRKALFPQRAGKLQVGPLEARVRTLDTFAASAARKSDAVDVEVMPLPDKGRPAGFFEQNVGHFQIAASLDRKTVKAGEAVTLRIVVRGRGNLRQLKLRPLAAVAGLKIYQPKISDRLQNSGAITGEKIVEYLLLPTKTGRIALPAISLDYFDPQRQRYVVKRAAALAVEVTGKLPVAGGGGDARQNVIGRNIRPPRPAAPLVHRVPGKPLGALQLLLVAFPLAALLVFSGVERLRARLTRQTERSLSRAASRRVRQHLRRAKDAQRAGNRAELFAALAAAIREQVSHQLGTRVEGLTREELRLQLEDRGFATELVDAVFTELDNCDFARFAPSASDDEQLGAAIERTRKLVRRIAGTAVGARR